MVELGKVPVREFSIVDVLSYFLPGAVMLFGIYLCKYFKNLYGLIKIENIAIQIFLLIIVSYLIGHVLHFPAVVIGGFINKLIGEPTIYLANPEEKQVVKFKAKLRNDFPIEFKKSLYNALTDFWTISNKNSNNSRIIQYCTLSEVLVEDACPNAWIIHERFYSTSNLLKALIIPTIFLGIVLFKHSIFLAISLFISSLIFGYRYYSLYVTCVKQIYNGFYLFYLTSFKKKEI